MTPHNQALWRMKPGGPFRVGDAPYTPPGSGELVVRARAVAVNPVDGISGMFYPLILPWVKFPAVVGGDVAGEVVEVGPDVTRFRPGDRVVGHAVGLEKNRNRSAEGAFQHYVVLLETMVSPIPETVTYEQAAVLPLTLSTAATGLFQKDHLGLPLPTLAGPERRETVLIWGGSTSVGSNAIQLTRGAGYRVVTTASERNFAYVQSLGAAAAVDYHRKPVVDDLVAAIGDQPLVGILAISVGSLGPCLKVADRTGCPRIAAAFPGVLVRLGTLGRWNSRVRVSAIWGGTLKDNEVGPGIYRDFLPGALAGGTYRTAPPPTVVGEGLAAIPGALETLRRGVSATKLVVKL